MAERNFDATNRADTSREQKYRAVFNLEENSLMPSLQHVSMIKVARTLWNQTDIKNQIVKYFNNCEQISPFPRNYSYSDSPYFDKEFKEIVNEISQNALQLALPINVREMLSNIVHPIGKEIFVWINYQDDYVFFNNPDYPKEKSIAVNYIDDLIWKPRGTIDYKETAKALLAKEKNLSDLYKYSLACAYCLEDDIAIIAPRVINTTLDLKSIQRQTMLYFWTAHITGDFTELDVEVAAYNSHLFFADFSTNEGLLSVLAQNSPHEVAIKYIWDKLSREEQSRQIVTTIAETSNNDFRCFLLSQISKKDEGLLFILYSGEILKHFLGDWLWGHCFLPTFHYACHLMRKPDYEGLFQAVVNKMGTSHNDIVKYNEYKATVKEVWKWAPKRIKDEVFEERDDYFGLHIFFKLFDKKNIDIIESILFDLNDVQKKKIVFTWIFRWNSYWQNLITSNQLDLIEWLIERTLFCREDVECFKKSFMNLNGELIAVQFIQNKEWNKLHHFLKWASDEDIRQIKIKLTHNSKICPDILKSIVENNNADFTELEKFFEWCASGNAEGVLELKKNMLKRGDCFYIVICKVILEDNYEFLEQIFNWCFVNDQKQVAQFKQYLYQGDQMYKILHSYKSFI